MGRVKRRTRTKICVLATVRAHPGAFWVSYSTGFIVVQWGMVASGVGGVLGVLGAWFGPPIFGLIVARVMCVFRRERKPDTFSWFE